MDSASKNALLLRHRRRLEIPGHSHLMLGSEVVSGSEHRINCLAVSISGALCLKIFLLLIYDCLGSGMQAVGNFSCESSSAVASSSSCCQRIKASDLMGPANEEPLKDINLSLRISSTRQGVEDWCWRIWSRLDTTNHSTLEARSLRLLTQFFEDVLKRQCLYWSIHHQTHLLINFYEQHFKYTWRKCPWLRVSWKIEEMLKKKKSCVKNIECFGY